MNRACSGISSSARSAGTTCHISMIPNIMPPLPQRCRRTGPLTCLPHALFSTRLAPAAIRDANGSLIDNACTDILYFLGDLA
jgi:hypothetical protein